nr:hypothetical protein [Reticulibacter mediterranei]
MGIGLKFFPPTMQHGTDDPKFFADLLLCGITLHALKHSFQFKLGSICLSWLVHLVKYLSIAVFIISDTQHIIEYLKLDHHSNNSEWEEKESLLWDETLIPDPNNIYDLMRLGQDEEALQACEGILQHYPDNEYACCGGERVDRRHKTLVLLGESKPFHD